MANEHIILASGDGHVGALAESYGDYLPKRLQAAFKEYLQGRIPRYASVKETSYWPESFRKWFADTEGYDPNNGTPVAWDPKMRLKALDHSGVAAEVFYPDDQSNNDPPWASGLATEPSGMTDGYPPELIRAGAQAYNRWLAEFCSTDPNRLLGATILGTLDDVNWCCEEIHRAHNDGLTTGVMLALEYYLPPYHHPRYDILWETLCELDLPVIAHIGRGVPRYKGDDPRMHMGVSLMDGLPSTLRPFSCLIMGGILERFPELRVAVAEIGVAWAPMFLGPLDAAFQAGEIMQAPRDVERQANLKMKPSEYFARQCYVIHSSNQRRYEFESPMIDMVPNTVFGSDIGHMEGWWPMFGPPEGTLPDPLPSIYDSFQPVEKAMPVDEARRLIWGGLEAQKVMPYLQENFFKLFRSVDRNALQAVADRVCPTAADIGLV